MNEFFHQLEQFVEFVIYVALCLFTLVLVVIGLTKPIEGQYPRTRSREKPFVVAGPDAKSVMASTSTEKVVNPFDRAPRKDYLSKDDYFMTLAFLSSQRSKDPSKQVGCCIVDKRDIILAVGYNGFPRGCPDSRLPWSKASESGSKLDTKYPFVVHAEANAILNKNIADLGNSRMYVTLFPCCECAKLLIQAGIREVIYYEVSILLSPVGVMCLDRTRGTRRRSSRRRR